MARGSNGESALLRHLRVLEAFDTWNPFLTLTQISEASGLPKSTTHRLVIELVRQGLLEELPDKTYRLGLRLWELASRTPGALGIRELARPWLSAVHERVGQHAQLGVLSGLDVLFVERLSAPDAVVNATLIGGRVPLLASSSGLVLLAGTQNANLVDRVVREGMHPLTPQGIQSEAELRSRLRQVHADGFAVTDGYIHPDARGIAVPIAGPLGDVYAAMGVVVPNTTASPLPFVDILQWAATRTAAALADLYASSPNGGIPAKGAPVYSGVSRNSLAFLSAQAHETVRGSVSEIALRVPPR
jgi:DNA-binding IclR family transcriptional regulator